jgi:hypothetical protein
VVADEVSGEFLYILIRRSHRSTYSQAQAVSVIIALSCATQCVLPPSQTSSRDMDERASSVINATNFEHANNNLMTS